MELRGHENVVETIVFAPVNAYPAIRELGGIVGDRSKQPGLYAATGGRDKFIKLWDASTGQLIRNLVSTLDPLILRSVCFAQLRWFFIN